MARRLLISAAISGVVLVAAPTASAAEGLDHVDVVEISGIIDERIVDFVVDTVADSTAQVVVLQVDSRGAVTSDARRLVELLENPPLPLVVWVGPAPAKAYGAAAHLVAAAPLSAAAPGAKIGYSAWFVSGGDRVEVPDVVEPTVDDVVIVDSEGAALVDVVTPTIGQLVVGLDGRVVSGRKLSTAVAVTGSDGVVRPEPAAETRFIKPGLWTRTLRLGATPEAAYLFLIVGLALATFEFYAAGVGLMAVVAVLALALAGYGIAVLPVRPWAVGLVAVGLVAYVADFQRNDLGWRSLGGTAALVIAGAWFVDAAPHFGMSWWVVVLVVVAAAVFFGIGMTTVVRSRFSTTTIGREELLGCSGVVVNRLDPDGVVEVAGARWKARGPRAAVSGPGNRVVVVAIDGIVLHVEPAGDDGESA